MLLKSLSLCRAYFGKQRSLQYLLVINLFFISFLIVLCLGSTLTADDYQFFDLSNSLSYFYLLTHLAALISGRYSYAFVVTSSIKIFGLKAVSILPIGSLLLLMFGAVYSSINLLKIMKKDTVLNKRFATQIAIFAVVGSLVTAPSIFDTFVWFSAAPAYVLSVAMLLIAVSLALRDLVTAKIHWLFSAMVFVVCLFAAGFLEVIPITLVLMGIAGLVTGYYIKNTRSKKLQIYSLSFLAAGCIGGAVVRFSPWTALRISSGKHFTTGQRIAITFRHLQLIPQYIFSWRILFSVALALLLIIYIGKLPSLRSKIGVFSISVCLIFLPCLIIGALAASSGLIEATNLASNRLLYDGTAGIMLGFGLLMYLAGSLIPTSIKQKTDFRGSIALSIVLLFCLAFGASSLSKVDQAVYVKKSMFQYREAVIQHDVATGRSSVRILPASILLKDSQVDDIGFGSPKTEVWEKALRGYYHIPNTTPLEFSNQAPAGYCTITSDSATYGKQTCTQIVNHADSLDYTTYQ
jgi:hypothetical protein